MHPGKVRASAATIVHSNRHTGDVISEELNHSLEEYGGLAMLQVLSTALLIV
jgi:hypothetical protein